MRDSSEAACDRGPRQAVLGLAAKILVSAVLLWFLLRGTDFERVSHQLRNASLPWLAVALALYGVMILTSAWRWRALLVAQHVDVPTRLLVSSYLVATFFNNFLPSNIGGDVVRIRDTVRPTGSRTLATLIVLVDRALGLIGLLIVAAVGCSATARLGGVGIVPVRPLLIWAGLLAVGGGFVAAVVAPQVVARFLHPFRVFHRDWVDQRLERLTSALNRFRGQPGALLNGLAGAVLVQFVLVGFYWAIAYSLHIPISSSHLAVLVPVSFVVQMLPVSVNGLGVREATFSYYFLRLRLPLESALVLSLLGAGLTLLFSVSGAVVYAFRR